MTRNSWVRILIFAILPAATALAAPSEQARTETFAVEPGDTLVLENDYGSVRVTGSDSPSLEIKFRTIAAEEARAENVSIVTRKIGTRVFAQVYYYDYESEAVQIEIFAPDFLNIMVSGANPALEFAELSGTVHGRTLTGFIRAENLYGSASLTSEDGNIVYRLASQPRADVRLETLFGNISCRVDSRLNLRSWLRAGRNYTWNDSRGRRGSLEKQLGTGGPLLYASAVSGDIDFTTVEGLAPLARDSEPAVREERTGVESRSDDEPERGEGNPGDAPRAVPASYPGGDETAVAGGGYSLKVNVDWVYVNTSVRDRNNRAVPNLQKSDFQVFEDGVPQEIGKFDSTEAPFNLLLLLDISGSTKEYLDMIKDASIEFTREIKASDRIALATFNSRTQLRQGFTNNRHEIAEAIRRIRSGGGTAFYDALHESVTDYMSGVEGRPAIVVFTDGVDNQLTGDYDSGSRLAFRDLYREVQEADTLIYTIFLDTEGSVSPGGRRGGGVGDILADIILGRTGPGFPRGGGRGQDRAYEEARRQLEMIADQTGGRMYAPRGIGDLGYVYDEIADDLRIQYTLGYTSTNPNRDGKWREIEVEIRRRPDLSVRARRGYYAAKN